jgi:hypothetical protein
MSPQLALFPMLIWLPFAHAPANGPTTVLTQKRIGDWTLTVQHDPFADQTGCRLASGRQSYERGALVIRLPRKIDTADAVYRIDKGPPMFVSWDRSTLASLGFALWQDDLENPSAGLVRIPVAKLATASTVQVEARPGNRVWTFSLKGFPAALAAAKQAGCG